MYQFPLGLRSFSQIFNLGTSIENHIELVTKSFPIICSALTVVYTIIALQIFRLLKSCSHALCFLELWFTQSDQITVQRIRHQQITDLYLVQYYVLVRRYPVCTSHTIYFRSDEISCNLIDQYFHTVQNLVRLFRLKATVVSTLNNCTIFFMVLQDWSFKLIDIFYSGKYL